MTWNRCVWIVTILQWFFPSYLVMRNMFSSIVSSNVPRMCMEKLEWRRPHCISDNSLRTILVFILNANLFLLFFTRKVRGKYFLSSSFCTLSSYRSFYLCSVNEIARLSYTNWNKEMWQPLKFGFNFNWLLILILIQDC